MEVASTPHSRTWRWHSHFSLERVGAIAVSLANMEVASPLLFRRCRWHPKFPLEGGGCIHPHSRRWRWLPPFTSGCNGDIPISLERVEAASHITFRRWRCHQLFSLRAGVTSTPPLRHWSWHPPLTYEDGGWHPQPS